MALVESLRERRGAAVVLDGSGAPCASAILIHYVCFEAEIKRTLCFGWKRSTTERKTPIGYFDSLCMFRCKRTLCFGWKRSTTERKTPDTSMKPKKKTPGAASDVRLDTEQQMR